jgi:hypothetical protein
VKRYRHFQAQGRDLSSKGAIFQPEIASVITKVQQEMAKATSPNRAYTTDSTTTSAASSRRSSFSAQQPQHPPDIMSRDFPKPSSELDLGEMLNRPALKHSLRHYVENWREAKPRTEPDHAAKKEALRKAKAELLRGWQEEVVRPTKTAN